MKKLALIAGGGRVPVEIADYCRRIKRPLYLIRLRDMADPVLSDCDGTDMGLGDFSLLQQTLKAEGCEAVCMVGYVKRPDFEHLDRDEAGALILPQIAAAGRGGDDALLRQLAAAIEAMGFSVEGAHQANPELLLGEGRLAGPEPSISQLRDIERAADVARAIGREDIGQGAVVVRGVVLAVEAQEGTDAMLMRVGGFSPVQRGTQQKPDGVLAKFPKPIQDLRLDMPVIGPRTLEIAAAVGLSGVIGQSGGLLINDRVGVIETAERLGLFVIGLPAQ